MQKSYTKIIDVGFQLFAHGESANIWKDEYNDWCSRRSATNFLTKNCPKKPSNTDTAMRYKAANKYNEVDKSYFIY